MANTDEISVAVQTIVDYDAADGVKKIDALVAV